MDGRPVVDQFLIGAWMFGFLLLKGLTILGLWPGGLGDDLQAAVRAAPVLGLVSGALLAAAAVELAYMLFTPGPDEAIDPLILGLAGTTILALSHHEQAAGAPASPSAPRRRCRASIGPTSWLHWSWWRTARRRGCGKPCPGRDLCGTRATLAGVPLSTGRLLAGRTAGLPRPGAPAVALGSPRWAVDGPTGTRRRTPTCSDPTIP